MEKVVVDDFVIGELACGCHSARAEILRNFEAPPRAPVVTHEEVISFVEPDNLAGVGIGLDLTPTSSHPRGDSSKLDSSIV